MNPPPGGSRLAIVERRDVLRVMDAGAAGDSVIVPGRTRWPAWLDDGAFIARSCYTGGRRQRDAEVVLTEVASGRDLSLYQPGAEDPPGIAPRVPHYVLPAPRSHRFAIVAATREGLGLFVRQIGDLNVPPLVMGAPLFPCWDPSGRFLAVHSGPELVVVDTKTGEQFQPSSGDAVGFRTPAYSDDGEILAYALSSEASVQLLFAQADGTGRRPGPRFRNGAVIGFQPRSHNCYVATPSEPDAGLFNWLWRVPRDSTEAELIHSGAFVAFTWSPRGDRIGLVYPSQSGDGSFGIYMLDPDGTVVAASEAFVPSEDQRAWLTFFDQYGKSHPQWSPGGEYLFFCGRAGSDRVPPSLGDSRGNALYAWIGERGAPLECLGPGEFAACGPGAP